MAYAGQLLQLVEILLQAAVGAVTTGTVGTWIMKRSDARVYSLNYFIFSCHPTSVTVSLAICGTVHHRFHAEAHVDVPAVRMTPALQTVGAVVTALAGLHLVLLGDLGVVLPGVAEVLEAGLVCALAAFLQIP